MNLFLFVLNNTFIKNNKPDFSGLKLKMES